MTSLEHLGYRQELRRTLTVWDLIVYGMVIMVPIAPFAVFGFVYTDARGMVPLAYLVGLAGMFFTAMSYASMSRAFRWPARWPPKQPWRESSTRWLAMASFRLCLRECTRPIRHPM